MKLPRPLNPMESRVLGALLEKSQATPDYYPMTVKALVAACNQKNNRNPVSAYSEGEIRHSLEKLRTDVLVWRTEGARAGRWNESITRRLGLKPPHRAIITLLLLRGPQTLGELRTRSTRLHAFDSIADVETALEELREGTEPIVQELPRQPGHKETRWRHLLGADADELPDDIVVPSAGPRSMVTPSSPTSSRDTSKVDELEVRLAKLEGQMQEVIRALEELTSPAD